MKVPIHIGNWEKNRGMKLEGVVIHIMQGTLNGTDSHFQTPRTYVSSHDGIGKKGQLHEYVEFKDKAYHAGRTNQSTWQHIKRAIWGSIINPNKYTYGIENEGFRGERWKEAQMQMLVIRTKRALDLANLPYTRDRVLSHHEIAIDKEDMSEWCDEIVIRLNNAQTPAPVMPDKKGRAIKLLEEAITLLK